MLLQTVPVVGTNIAPSATGLSLWSLFIHANLIVQLVMIGLLACSIWVWAIAIDKTVLYARSRREMDKFEAAFWSGESLEELYRTLSGKPSGADRSTLHRSVASS